MRVSYLFYLKFYVLFLGAYPVKSYEINIILLYRFLTSGSTILTNGLKLTSSELEFDTHLRPIKFQVSELTFNFAPTLRIFYHSVVHSLKTLHP